MRQIPEVRRAEIVRAVLRLVEIYDLLAACAFVILPAASCSSTASFLASFTLRNSTCDLQEHLKVGTGRISKGERMPHFYRDKTSIGVGSN